MEAEITKIETVHRLPYIKAREKYYRQYANTSPCINKKETYANIINNNINERQIQPSTSITTILPVKNTMITTQQQKTIENKTNNNLVSKSITTTSSTKPNVITKEDQRKTTQEVEITITTPATSTNNQDDSSNCLANRYNLLNDAERKILFSDEMNTN